jgi:sulfoxide reductase heme-binding subunit YedZ
VTRGAALTPLVWIASLVPLATMLWAVTHHRLGPDPYRGLTTETGVWTIWFLCATLAITPLRRLTHWNGVIRYRRTLGLFAFLYATLHLLSYVVFDRFAALEFGDGMVSWATARDLVGDTVSDVLVRPFLLIGMISFVIMVPLAVSSSAGMIRRFGGRRWQRLHRLVYAAAFAGVLHHWWPLADRLRFDAYGLTLGVLFAYRIYRAVAHAGAMAWPVQLLRAAPHGSASRGQKWP